MLWFMIVTVFAILAIWLLWSITKDIPQQVKWVITEGVHVALLIYAMYAFGAFDGPPRAVIVR